MFLSRASTSFVTIRVPSFGRSNFSVCWRFIVFLFVLPIAVGQFSGCAGGNSQNGIGSANLLSPQIQEKVRSAATSVVGVGGVFDYDVRLFHHAIVNGGFVRDESSPSGYRLVSGDGGISFSHTLQETHGTGLILYQDDQKAVVLTSRHILVMSDTIMNYYRDSSGASTDIAFSQSIRTQSTYHVYDQNNQLRSARILYTDARTDLGLLILAIQSPVGLPFAYAVAYSADVDWGDLAFVYGYPRGMKQLSMGVVSHSPYPGGFALDITARFGYSGGPVLLVQKDGTIALAGIMRAVPSNKIQYIAPPPDVLPGQKLTDKKITESIAGEYEMVDYGTVYAVGAVKIGQFIEASVPFLESEGIHLSPRFLPQ